MASNNDAMVKASDSAVSVGLLSTNTKRTGRLIEEINSSTDCDAIKEKLKITGDELKELLKELGVESATLLAKFFPISIPPLPHPVLIVKWTVKSILGDTLPQLLAYIRIIKAAIDIGSALQSLAQAARNTIPKLQQCAIDAVNDRLSQAGLEPISSSNTEATFNTLIAVAVDKATTDIDQDIVNELNSAGVVGVLSSTTTAIATTTQLADDLDSQKAAADATVTTSLADLGVKSASIAATTGISFPVNTSSSAAFTTSIESGAVSTYETQVTAVLNQPNVINSVGPTLSGTTNVGSTLTANPGTWQYVANTFTYQWYRESDPIYSATTSTYALSAIDVGSRIKCVVLGENKISAIFSNTVQSSAVTYNPPNNTVAPVISDSSPTIGQTISCSTGTWTNSPTLSYQWQWAHTSANIYAANTSSYVVDVEDFGMSLTCITSAVTNAGQTSVRSTPTSRVSGLVTYTGAITVTGNVTATSTMSSNTINANTINANLSISSNSINANTINANLSISSNTITGKTIIANTSITTNTVNANTVNANLTVSSNTINANTVNSIDVNSENVTSNNVTDGTVVLGTHTHANVVVGSANTGPPN